MPRRRRAAVPVVAALAFCVVAACAGKDADLVGLYELDRDALWKEWQPRLAAEKPDLLEQMEQNIQSLRFDLDLAEDGTFTASSIMATEGLPEGTESSIDSSGTWTRAGEKVTLIVTRARGQSVDGEISGTLREGVLRMELGPGNPVVLRKRR
jgi:hypothetical protein